MRINELGENATAAERPAFPLLDASAQSPTSVEASSSFAWEGTALSLLGGDDPDLRQENEARFTLRTGASRVLLGIRADRAISVGWVPEDNDTKMVVSSPGILWSAHENETPFTMKIAEFPDFGRVRGFVDLVKRGKPLPVSSELLELSTQALVSLKERADEDLEEWAAQLVDDVTKGRG